MLSAELGVIRKVYVAAIFHRRSEVEQGVSVVVVKEGEQAIKNSNLTVKRTRFVVNQV